MPGSKTKAGSRMPRLSFRASRLAAQVLGEWFDVAELGGELPSHAQLTRCLDAIRARFSSEGVEDVYTRKKMTDALSNRMYKHRVAQHDSRPASWAPGARNGRRKQQQRKKQQQQFQQSSDAVWDTYDSSQCYDNNGGGAATVMDVDDMVVDMEGCGAGWQSEDAPAATITAASEWEAYTSQCSSSSAAAPWGGASACQAPASSWTAPVTAGNGGWDGYASHGQCQGAPLEKCSSFGSEACAGGDYSDTWGLPAFDDAGAALTHCASNSSAASSTPSEGSVGEWDRYLQSCSAMLPETAGAA